jgi:hypothetical protein
MQIELKTTGEISLDLEILASGTPGITSRFGAALAEAASVCLDERGHSSPAFMTVHGTLEAKAELSWQSPDDQARRCWADPEVATEYGAYGLATLLVPEISGLTVVERSKKGTGFDYWLGEKGDEGPLFQGKARLEVSGIRTGSDTAVESRAKQKLRQTQPSDGAVPAIVVVVEFGRPQSLVAKKCAT